MSLLAVGPPWHMLWDVIQWTAFIGLVIVIPLFAVCLICAAVDMMDGL